MQGQVLSYAISAKEIGIGHLTRQRDFLGRIHERLKTKVSLITNSLEGIEHLFINSPVQLIYLDTRRDQHPAQISEIVKSQKPNIFILDDLELDIDMDFSKEMKNHIPCFLSISDDSFYRDPLCHIYVNANPLQRIENYPQDEKVRLIGPKYFILPPEIKLYRSRVQPIAKRVKNLLISLGGTDHNNLLIRLFNILEPLCSMFSVHLITGPAAGLDQKAVEKRRQLALANLQISSFVKDFSESVIHSDLCLTASGNTIFHRIALGTPGLTLCQLARQNEIASEFERRGCNLNLGMGKEISSVKIMEQIIKLGDDIQTRINMREAGMLTVDGSGADRIIDEIYKFITFT